MENSKTNHTSAKVEFVLRKKELKEEFWPRLLKDSKKMHFLKTDFDKVGASLQITIRLAGLIQDVVGR